MVPVLWLIGPPGVGKTTVAWQIRSDLAEAGVRVAYVDIDQLGIVSAPDSDPDRYDIKLRNLYAVIGGYAAAGAECVVVSGVADPAVGVPLRSVRLRADGDEIARRYIERMGSTDGLAESLAEAAQYDKLDGPVVDTTGLSVSEAAQRVWELAGDWLAQAAPIVEPVVGDGAGRILWLCGATGVGKSTVGFPLFFQLGSYVDVDQIGCYDGGHAMRARNLAAVWNTFRSVGARAMVVVGPLEDEAAFQLYRDAMPAAEFTLVRLHGDRDVLTDRIRLRANGRGSWAQPGDPLLGLPEPDVQRVAGQAALMADSLERQSLGIRVDTTGLPPAEIVDKVAALLG